MSKEICIYFHGFSINHDSEIEQIKSYILPDTEIIIPNLFSHNDLLDIDISLWINRAFLCVEDYLSKGYQIHLIGYSSGALLALYCASKLKITNCILLSPSFTINNPLAITNLLGNKNIDECDYFSGVSNNFLSAISSLINLTRPIQKIECSLYIIHGMIDTVCSFPVVREYYNRIECLHKQCIFLENGTHCIYSHPVDEIKTLINHYIKNSH